MPGCQLSVRFPPFFCLLLRTGGLSDFPFWRKVYQSDDSGPFSAFVCLLLVFTLWLIFVLLAFTSSRSLWYMDAFQIKQRRMTMPCVFGKHFMTVFCLGLKHIILAKIDGWWHCSRWLAWKFNLALLFLSCRTWNYPPLAQVLASAANYMICDDHEVVDDLGEQLNLYRLDRNSLCCFLSLVSTARVLTGVCCYGLSIWLHVFNKVLRYNTWSLYTRRQHLRFAPWSWFIFLFGRRRKGAHGPEQQGVFRDQVGVPGVPRVPEAALLRRGRWV